MGLDVGQFRKTIPKLCFFSLKKPLLVVSVAKTIEFYSKRRLKNTNLSRGAQIKGLD